MAGFVVIVIILFSIAIFIVPKLIKIFGNETFDENKATGRTVRKTPEQKALRFKIYAAGLFLLFIVIAILIGIN